MTESELVKVAVGALRVGKKARSEAHCSVTTSLDIAKIVLMSAVSGTETGNEVKFALLQARDEE